MQHWLDWFKLNTNATFIAMKITWTNVNGLMFFSMQQAMLIIVCQYPLLIDPHLPFKPINFRSWLSKQIY